MLKYTFYSLCIMLLCLSSCKEAKDKKAAIKFGEIEEYYPAFGKDHKAEILEVKVQLDFNEYAIQDNSYVDLEFVSQDGIPIPNTRFYVNGEAIIGKTHYRFRAKEFAQNKVVNLGVQFLEGIEEEHYKGYLRVKKSNLDRVDDTDIATSGTSPVLYRWTAKYKRTMHPIVQGLLALLAAILSFLLIWFLLIKPLFYPRFRGGEIEFISPALGSFRLKGYRKFQVGGKTKIKQGAISRIFTGKIGQAMKDQDIDLTLIPHKKRGTVWTRYKAGSEINMGQGNRGTFYNFEEYDFKTNKGKKMKFVYKNRKHNRRG